MFGGSQCLETWGGVSADPVVSAVLNAVGKRYLVEHWENEDGSQEYDLYSDGFIVQKVILVPSKNNTVTFPKEFRDLKYKISTCSWDSVQQTSSTGTIANWNWTWFGLSLKTTTGISKGGNVSPSKTISIEIIAQGYAA